MKEIIFNLFTAVSKVLALFGVTAEDNEFAWVNWVFTVLFGSEE